MVAYPKRTRQYRRNSMLKYAYTMQFQTIRAAGISLIRFEQVTEPVLTPPPNCLEFPWPEPLVSKSAEV